jgi:hypothetical protein
MRNATLVEGAVPINKLKKLEVGSSKLESNQGEDSPQSTVHSPQSAVELSPRKAFLLANPRAREVWEAFVAKLQELTSKYRASAQTVAQQMVDTAELGRQIGLLVVELENELPGKRLTEDFWRQHPELQLDRMGQPITREMLDWFVGIARKYPNQVTIEDIAKVARGTQQLLLPGGFELESERAPQVAHAPAAPIAQLKERLDVVQMREVWSRVKSDGAYWQDGHLRPDLKETLRVELEPSIVFVMQLKEELGL